MTIKIEKDGAHERTIVLQNVSVDKENEKQNKELRNEKEETHKNHARC